MQFSYAAHEVIVRLEPQLASINAQLSKIRESINQLLTGEKNIMDSLAALQAAQQAIDQAIQALGTEEAADVTAINSAITLIQGLQSTGGISDTQAAPIIADLQAQVANIQAATAALGTARTSLGAVGTAQSGTPAATPSGSAQSGTPATPNAA